ncbi:MAG TPA: trypsin-like peptidase domain-containing protein [Candidatus Tectomicrobia bacterium]|nr:trypsin-like peptidase domain-containing protein [Candidatus Tectomicrobia bacterium]
MTCPPAWRLLGACLVTATLLARPAAAQSPEREHTLLRATPAVALVAVEVGADVTVRCPGEPDRTVAVEPVRTTASGFFVDPQGWLITNAHVVADAEVPPASLSEPLARRALPREGCTARRVTPKPSVSVVLQNGRRLPATIAKISPPPTGEMSGRDLALLRVDVADVPTLALAPSDSARIADPVAIIAFPAVVLTHELLRASTMPEPSVTTGAVSGFQIDRASRPVIQIDAAVEAGSSGAPAIDETGRVIGVVTVVRGAEGQEAVQGFNFVIPASAVRDFVAGTGVRLDAPGAFDAAWDAGVRLFFARRHSRASGPLREAARLVPDLPVVQRVIGDNAERAAQEPWLPWRTVGAVLVAVGVIGYGVLLARRARRNRFRIAPAEVARLLESPTPPALVDVRDEATYARSPVKLPHARHVAADALARGAAQLDIERSRTLVAYCT